MLNFMVVTQDFLEFRMWFNKRFSLSLNGKFKGLLSLGSHLDLFIHRFKKMFNSTARYSRFMLNDVVVMRFSGLVIKLYNR